MNQNGCYCTNAVSVGTLLVLIKSGHLCEECGQRQLDRLVFVSGEPRNIALIAHWDGWQSFGSPGRHSCGKCLQNISI